MRYILLGCGAVGGTVAVGQAGLRALLAATAVSDLPIADVLDDPGYAPAAFQHAIRCLR